MIELKSDKLAVSFPELPLQPELAIDLQRTLRLPDDEKSYPLPPGFGSFPLRHIDDYANRVPQNWLQRGGVLLPMWQSEALWVSFRTSYIAERRTAYPFAVKIATGKINAVTGEAWTSGLNRNPQNYLVTPGQPWLDGYCVQKGIIRQFVAMPLGQGYSVEEQLTGAAEFGGMQIEVFPMKAEVFEKRFPRVQQTFWSRAGSYREADLDTVAFESCGAGAMGLSPGGRMRQEIYEDPFSIHEWDTEHGTRCFIHLVNSQTWRAITGERPPSKPINAKEYARWGYPWFDYYDAELRALAGAKPFGEVKSVKEMSDVKREPLPNNDTVTIPALVQLKGALRKGQVRETDF